MIIRYYRNHRLRANLIADRLGVIEPLRNDGGSRASGE
jgi:hypothetical protein